MKNNKEITELSMDMILKMTPEDFRDTMKGFDLGTLNSLSNILKSSYEQSNVAKNSLGVLLETNKVPKEDVDKITGTINDLYLAMQLIEDRYYILTEIIKAI